jgi:predicted transcriptional regulator
MTTVSAKLPDNVAKALNDMAQKTHKSVDHLILQALIEYLSEQGDLEIAHARYMDPDDEIVSIEEAKKRLGL